MNYLEVLEELKNYYANLLIIQYHGKPKATANIKMFAELILASLIIFQIRDSFDWKTATGNQLDIIGKWLGIDRFYYQVELGKKWFTLLDWNKEPNALQGGFSTYEDFDTLEGGIISNDNLQGQYNSLSDDEFRLLIGLRIIQCNIDTTCKSIDDNIWNYFNGKVYTVWDIDNRQLNYCFTADMLDFMFMAKDKGCLPCPPTVTLNLQEIE